MDTLLKIEEVQSILNIGRSKAYELINKREIDFVTIGNVIRVKQSALEEYISSKTVTKKQKARAATQAHK